MYTMDDRDDSASWFPFYWLLLFSYSDQWQQTYVLVMSDRYPHQQCCSWVDDHRKYARRVSITVWGISRCGQTMGLLPLAYVHILVVNNQAIPRTVHNIIQNYRYRIKRKMCLTVSFHNYDCEDIWKCPWF